ncbi:helix-turn-helix domain-containing protein [Robbsia sp. KACC 23696]|uniref:helix-turn-helix domain-containing protein n=1 Tax=Robbsia sp. KACC 23696 TaxID=3149231 RepID=UPI00325B4006
MSSHPLDESASAAPDEAVEGGREAGTTASGASDSDGSLEEQLARLLAVLVDPSAASGLSLARVSKRSGLPMSTLRRLLTVLADADLATWTLEESGRGSACLTPAGRAAIGNVPGHDTSSPI